MKTRIVFWGTLAENEKVLVALQLDPEQNKVHEWLFPQSSVTEEFANAMMRDWRNDKEVVFPDGTRHSEKALTASESLLSDGLKPDKDDIISRAQTEWHFIVLSHKLRQGFENEFQELKEKTSKLLKYDNDLWEELKTFWDKVQNQVRERNLFKEHAQILRDGTNALFEHLKKLRKAVDEEFDRSSKDQVGQFQKKLDEINTKLSNNLSLQPIFDELKQLQHKLQGVDMNRNDRSMVWDQIDKLFKHIKDKRFGHKEGLRENNGTDRLSRRFDGLVEALNKMESSIKRDYNDLEFEKRKVANSEGQLEAQIRQAKIKMIEERIRSKEEKLQDMNSTRTELEKRQDQEKQREIRRQEKFKLEQARHAAEDRIKDEIKKAAEARKDDGRIEKAAEAIAATKPAPHRDNILDAIGTTLGETLEDVVDTVMAVSEVVGEKIHDFAENLQSDKPTEEEKPV